MHPISSVTWPLLCMDINLSLVLPRVIWLLGLLDPHERPEVQVWPVYGSSSRESWSEIQQFKKGFWNMIFIDVPFFWTGRVCSPCSTIIFSRFIYLHMPPLNHSTDTCNYLPMFCFWVSWLAAPPWQGKGVVSAAGLDATIHRLLSREDVEQWRPETLEALLVPMLVPMLRYSPSACLVGPGNTWKYLKWTPYDVVAIGLTWLQWITSLGLGVLVLQAHHFQIQHLMWCARYLSEERDFMHSLGQGASCLSAFAPWSSLLLWQDVDAEMVSPTCQTFGPANCKSCSCL